MRKFVNFPDAKEHMRKTSYVFCFDRHGVISFKELSEYGRKVLKMEENMIKLTYKAKQ